MDRYRELFDNVRASETLKMEVRNMTNQTQNKKERRKIPAMAILAAALTLALMGTALAEAFLPGTLRGWFSRQWEESTGREPDAEQVVSVERLTQSVGVSDTDSGVTVTLDSITLGNSSLWMMLKLDGDIPAKKKPELFHFEDVDLTFNTAPDSVMTPSSFGYGFDYMGITEDGKLSILINYSVTLSGEDTLFSGYAAELRLGALMYSDSVAVSGNWTLPFALDAVQEEVLTLDSALVPTMARPDRKAETVEIQNIRVSATGIRFTQDLNYDEVPEILDPDLMGVVLSDGSLIPSIGGGSRWTGDVAGDTYTGDWATDMTWRVPVDLSQVVGVQFGDKIIPLR